MTTSFTPAGHYLEIDIDERDVPSAQDLITQLGLGPRVELRWNGTRLIIKTINDNTAHDLTIWFFATGIDCTVRTS